MVRMTVVIARELASIEDGGNPCGAPPWVMSRVGVRSHSPKAIGAGRTFTLRSHPKRGARW